MFSNFGNFGGGGFNFNQDSGDIDIGGFRFNIGGGDGGFGFPSFGGGGGGGGSGGSSYRKSAFYTPPRNIGRPSRKSQKNPFSGLETQSYDQLKEKCQSEGILFEDPEFEAEDASIFFSKRPPRPFEWKRPHEICDNPSFLVGGASRFDVKQGELGDCWLLAAIASLTCSEKLLHKVIMPEQNFEDNYCGIFRFRIWHQGEWIDVVVDDRLPTYNGQLVFMHSAEVNEFWSALLEKAYAKLNGSYEALKGGSTSEAMEDFTGGVTEMFDLREAPSNMFQIMMKAFERSALMGCSIDADPGQLEAELDNGLVMGHAYSVTAVRFVDVQTPRISGKIPLIRVRNPWGNKVEWQGAWSDSSREWGLISDDEKVELGLVNDNDGEFWMSYQDFSSNFQKLEICNLGPDEHTAEDDEGEERKRWAVTSENGTWTPRVSAGGCRNYLDTFWTNPQYRVSLTDPDEDDEDDLCTMIVGLLQKDRRKKRKEGLDMLTIGYCIYKLDEEQPGNLDLSFFKYNASVAKSPSFINLREVCGRHKLPPGHYCIVPSTFEPHQNGDFLLRIFSEHKNTSTQLDEQTGYQPQIRGGRAPVPPPRHNYRPEPEPTSEEEEQEASLRQYFRQLAGEDMEIDAFELQEVLNSVFQREFSFPGFTIDTCRSMVAMHDGDMSGKLGYEEFKALWTDLRRWKTVFKEFDRDGSGNLNSYELRSAFRHVGFSLSNNTLKALVMRYSKRDGNIDFGDFVACAVRLKTMIETFKTLEVQGSGRAFFNMDDFIQTTMYS
ncbi:calpain-9-like isoform X2 [Liolophura sinensis]|uniref:calpain-9-like isoform X2 n=1 Tax=Liolophura sinensis TaxID=3198878 RepID=UPI0031585B2F